MFDIYLCHPHVKYTLITPLLHLLRTGSKQKGDLGLCATELQNKNLHGHLVVGGVITA